MLFSLLKGRKRAMRADALAKKLHSNNYYDLWKEVKVLNNCKTSLPSDIEGVSGTENIAEKWHEHYQELFNCIKSEPFVLNNVDPNENLVIRPDDIFEAISMLDNNKACDMDHIYAEHLKYGSQKLCPLLSMCFTGLLIHGVLPDSLLSQLRAP